MRIKKQASGVAEGDLTPMIDMTFQLIAFFMVLVNFSQAEQTELIQLPSSALAKAPDEQPTYPLTINIRDDGKLLIAGQTYDAIDSIGIKLDQERQFAQDKKSEVTIIIRAHKDTETGKVQELIKKCQDSGLETFALRVKEVVPGSSK